MRRYALYWVPILVLKCLPFTFVFFFCSHVYISVYMLLGKSKWRWHTDRSELKKSTFRMIIYLEWGSRKGLKLSQIIFKYVIFFLNVNLEKVKQNKVRKVLVQKTLQNVPKLTFWHILDLNFLLQHTIYFTSMLLMMFNISKYSILQRLCTCALVLYFIHA